MKDSDLIFGLMASLDKEAYSFGDLRYLTAPFQVSEPSLRTNLSRMTASGVIASRRKGRRAYYRFSGKGRRIGANVSHGFTALDWSAWDGTYWGVTFSVPAAHGDTRHYIRKKLTKYRFACLNPGLWIRPAHPHEAIPETLQTILSSGYCRLIRFTNFQEFTRGEADAMWNLTNVNHQFTNGLSMINHSEKTLASLSPQHALVERMTVGDAIVSIIFSDPMLPPRFLPPGWQGDAIRERFQRFDNLARKQSKPYWERIFRKEDVL